MITMTRFPTFHSHPCNQQVMFTMIKVDIKAIRLDVCFTKKRETQRWRNTKGRRKKRKNKKRGEKEMRKDCAQGSDLGSFPIAIP